jgi:hypothetical protein
MHRRSGKTSQCPEGRVPPQGPFRSLFGHRWEQMKAVWLRMHSPQRWQRKTGILTMFSRKSMDADTFLARLDRGRPFVEKEFMGKGFSCFCENLFVFLKIYDS